MSMQMCLILRFIFNFIYIIHAYNTRRRIDIRNCFYYLITFFNQRF